MRTLEVSQRSLEDIIRSALENDLANIGEWDAEAKDDIKALKRVINFYSVIPPYKDVCLC